MQNEFIEYLKDSEVLGNCRYIIVNYLENCIEVPDENIKEVSNVKDDNKILKHYLIDMINLFAKGVGIIEREEKENV